MGPERIVRVEVIAGLLLGAEKTVPWACGRGATYWRHVRVVSCHARLVEVRPDTGPTGGAAVHLSAAEVRALWNILGLVAAGESLTEKPEREMADAFRLRSRRRWAISCSTMHQQQQMSASRRRRR
jgi:hypothetical protein